jgi:hypothetical protein
MLAALAMVACVAAAPAAAVSPEAKIAMVTNKAPLATSNGTHTWKWEIVADVFEGVVQGFFTSASFPDIKSCAGDLETAYDDLSDAIKGFVSDDATEVADGLKDIAGAMTALKAALTDCKATEGDIEAFVTAMKAFKSPWDFIYHVGKDLIVNGADIFSEISDAVTQWEAQSYRQAGNDIGTALAQMVIGQDESA